MVYLWAACKCMWVARSTSGGILHVMHTGGSICVLPLRPGSTRDAGACTLHRRGLLLQHKG
jgi:hypothetical protein